MLYRYLGTAILALLLATGQAQPREIHVAAQGSPATESPDGSAAKPFNSLAEAFAARAISGGDRVLLAGGSHGPLLIGRQQFHTPVDIGPVPGAQVHVDRIDVRDSTFLSFRDMQVWPTTPPPEYTGLLMVHADASDIRFDRMTVSSVADPASYPTWTQQQWLDTAVNGAFLRGPRGIVRDSTFTAVKFGIQSAGADGLVEGNLVEGFSADGLRGTGDRSVFRHNIVRNCAQVDGNHADGFQSWSLGPDRKPGTGQLTGLVIDGNTFHEWVHPVASPVRCQLQGIGLFDGMFKDLVIQNNLIEVTAYHGIAVFGGINTRILNNTVVDASGNPGNRPWIMIAPHKDGRPSHGGVVANNLAMDIKVASDRARPVTLVRNLDIGVPLRMFESPQRRDFRPKRGGAAIDAGDAKWAPKTDLTGQPRPVPARPDIGAIERR